MKTITIYPNKGFSDICFPRDYFFESTINDVLDDHFMSIQCNMIEMENSYVIEAKMPGIDTNDIKLTIENGILGLSAYQSSEIKNRFRRLYEFRSSSMKRTFVLPQNVDVKNISMKAMNGIVTITIPKVMTNDTNIIELNNSPTNNNNKKPSFKDWWNNLLEKLKI